jgi:hypothetical protein
MHAKTVSKRAGDLFQNRFFRVFALNRKNVKKNCISSHFSLFFGGKTYTSDVFIGGDNHNPTGLDTIQEVGHAILQVLVKSTLNVVACACGFVQAFNWSCVKSPQWHHP